MSVQTRREYLIRTKQIYLKASVIDKSKILDECSKTTGLNRKYIIQRFSPKVDLAFKKERQRKARACLYTNRESYYLKKLWEVLDYPCGQRLAPMIPEMIVKLRRFNELSVPADSETKLRAMTASTIDIKLAPFRSQRKKRIMGTTKPGTLLKKHIPIRTVSWDEKRVGFCELDTVAHCGEHAGGEYANTLNITDILTGWTEQEVVMGRAQYRVTGALKQIEERLPFALAGIDPDNGSEFINWQLYRHCMEQDIQFTRGRPYHKNDNAHIEQKNWTHVRKIFGYRRIESEALMRLMNDLCRNELRLYQNFFQPRMKLIKKQRVGAHHERIKRTYDTPQTPYQRVLACNGIDQKEKEKIITIYEQLNPAELKRTIEKKLKYFYQQTSKQHLSKSTKKQT